MRQFNEDTLTAEVVARLKKTKNPRLREIMASAVKHLHIFVDGDPYLDGDAVFAVKNSLVGKYRKVKDAALAKQRGLSNPFQTLEFDFRLSPGKGKTRKKIAASDVVA